MVFGKEEMHGTAYYIFKMNNVPVSRRPSSYSYLKPLTENTFFLKHFKWIDYFKMVQGQLNWRENFRLFIMLLAGGCCVLIVFSTLLMCSRMVWWLDFIFLPFYLSFISVAKKYVGQVTLWSVIIRFWGLSSTTKILTVWYIIISQNVHVLKMFSQENNMEFTKKAIAITCFLILLVSC